MNNQKGFTLIELIVVIVILGILSAVAVPKFVNMQDEAKQAAVEGARGSVKSAIALVHAKWLVSSADPVVVEGGTVDVDAYGYPTAASIQSAAGLTDDYDITAASSATPKVETITRDGESVGTGIFSFTYTEATATAPPQVSAVVKGS